MYHKIDLQENERNKMTNEERGKHMKRKKLVAILLTAAMTAGMLAGCGSSGGSTGGTSDSKASSEERLIILLRKRERIWRSKNSRKLSRYT